jgi:hypothetical protein
MTRKDALIFSPALMSFTYKDFIRFLPVVYCLMPGGRESFRMDRLPGTFSQK